MVSYEILLSSQPFPQTPIQLGPAIANTPQALPIYGEIQTDLGTATQGALILGRLENGSTWSTFISDTTSWVLPIAPLRTSDLRAYYCQVQSCTATTSITLTILAEEGDSTVQTTLEETQPLINPIIIGQPYSVNPMNLEQETSTATVSAVKGVQATPTRKPTSWNVSILNPKEDISLRFPKPLIRGEGVPGTEVTITLESAAKQIDTIMVQDDGTWLWTPKLPLEPGIHTVTIETTDTKGKSVKLTRSFSIFKSGEQVLAASSPSATLAPSPTPSIVPTSTPILPTVTPTPDMPVSASFLPSVMFVAGGLILVLLGLAVL